MWQNSKTSKYTRHIHTYTNGSKQTKAPFSIEKLKRNGSNGGDDGDNDGSSSNMHLLKAWILCDLIATELGDVDDADGFAGWIILRLCNTILLQCWEISRSLSLSLSWVCLRSTPIPYVYLCCIFFFAIHVTPHISSTVANFTRYSVYLADSPRYSSSFRWMFVFNKIDVVLFVFLKRKLFN